MTTSPPPHKRTKMDSLTTTTAVTANSNLNANQSSNNQNKYKFTLNPNNVNLNANSTNNMSKPLMPANNSSSLSTNNNRQATYSSNQNNRPNIQATIQNSNNNSTSKPNYVASNNQNNSLINNQTVKALLEDDDDDDIDISDSELIRASQVVESQLKFTNNVHHTTSNALNIFSQFNTTSSIVNATQMAPPLHPPSSNISYHSNANNAYNLNDNLSSIDDFRYELSKLKNENMQKEGEVKILRDKLKRLEQDQQKWRQEKDEQLKRQQLKEEEAKKLLKKQIELKEMDNQFKHQEILELTMKNKQLESTLKKSSTNSSANVTSSLNSSVLNTSQRSNIAPPPNKLIKPTQNQFLNQQPKMPTKRMATESYNQFTSSIPSVDLLIDDDDDDNQYFSTINNIESQYCSQQNSNNNQSTENNMKRPMQPLNQNTASNQTKANYNPGIAKQNYQPPLTAPSSSTIKNETVKHVLQGNILQNTTNIIQTPSSVQSSKDSISKQQHSNLVEQVTPVSVLTKNTSMTTPTNIKNATPLNTSTSENDLKQIDKIIKAKSEKSTKLLETKSKSATDTENINTPTSNIYNQISTSNSSLVTTAYKRACTLNTRSTNLSCFQRFSKKNRDDASSSHFKNNKLYELTDLFSETSNQIYQFNFKNSQSPPVQQKIEHSNAIHLNKKLNNLYHYIKNNLRVSSFMNVTYASSQTTIIERIEFVMNRLNDELTSLIHLLLQEQSDLLESKTPISTSKFSTIVDLLCLAFDIYFNLFTFRVTYLIRDFNKQQSLSKNKKTASISQVLIPKLVKAKNDLLALISTLLKSINFPSSKTNDKNTKSPSFSSYFTLKVLNTILDSFNCLLYFPNIFKLDEYCNRKEAFKDSSFSLTLYFASIIDNLHNIFNNKLNIMKLENTNDENSEKLDAENEIELIEIDNDDEKEGNRDENEEDDDDGCIFQLFYHKMTKYFGDVVYALELQEDRAASNDESNTHQPQSMNQQNDQQLQMITTIATDNDSSTKKSAVIVDLTASSESPKLPQSKSQTDLMQYDFLQSQVPPTVNSVNKSNGSNNAKIEASKLEKVAQTSSTCSTNSKSIDLVNSSAIQSLQIDFLNKFLNYLNFYELFSQFEFRLILKCKKSPNSLTNNQKCACYKDMFNSFLVLIDYKFNEKYINGTNNLSFRKWWFQEPLTCYASYLDFEPNLSGPTLSNDDSPTKLSMDTNETMEQINNSLIKKEFSRRDNSHMYLLIVKSCSTFLTLFTREDGEPDKSEETLQSNDKIDENDHITQMRQLRQTRMEYFHSCQDDYRLKNFFCLYLMADTGYEDFLNKSNLFVSNEQSYNMESNECQLQSKIERVNNLNSSLNSFREAFKKFLDNYFE